MVLKRQIFEFGFFYSNVEHSASSSLKFTQVNYILFTSYLKFTSKILNLLFVLKVDVSLIDWNLVIKHKFNLNSRLLISNFISWCNIISTHITPVFHSHGNQSIGLHQSSIAWFLYECIIGLIWVKLHYHVYNLLVMYH